ncbi:hypothetical protein [Terasakiella pusilla]|uniref:hypothetical protein n=1 Tax=Terasakiella pusilla TaxID=64973 RepID=UPI003AA9A0C1
MPDSSGYLAYAEHIANNANWFREDQYLFRMVGYPYLIYVLQSAAGEHWEFFLWLLQSSYSLFVTAIVYYAAFCFFRSVKVSLFISFLYSFSIFLFLDNVILTDSLSGHSISAVFSLFVICFKKNTYNAFYFLIAGFFLFFSFLVREGSFFIIAALVPLLIYMFAKGVQKRSVVYMTLCLVLFLAPVLLGKSSVESWNEKRTGHHFVTTGAETVYLYALVGPATSMFPEIFSSDHVFDQTFREKIKTTNFSETLFFIQHMKRELGWTSFDLISYSKAKYIQYISSNPLIPLYIMGSNMKPNTFVSLFQPALAIGQIISRSEDNFKYWRARFLARDLIMERKYSLFIPVVFMSAETAITIFIFAIFLFVGPYHVVKKIRENGLIPFLSSQNGFVFCLALGFVGVWMIHALVHLEARYHSGANICVLISALFLIKEYPKLTRRKLVKLFD